MAGENLDIMSLLLNQQQEQQQQSLDPASFIRSLTEQPQTAQQPAAVVPTRAQFEPGKLDKKERNQLIASSIGDFVGRYFALKHGRPIPASGIEEFVKRRNTKAEKDFQDALREFEKSEKDQLRKEEVDFREEVREERKRSNLAREQQAIQSIAQRVKMADADRDFQGEQREADRVSREEIARISASRESAGAGKRRETSLRTVKTELFDLGQNLDEVLQESSPDQIRLRFEQLLDLEDIPEIDREGMILRFIQLIEPRLRQAELNAQRGSGIGVGEALAAGPVPLTADVLGPLSLQDPRTLGQLDQRLAAQPQPQDNSGIAELMRQLGLGK